MKTTTKKTLTKNSTKKNTRDILKTNIKEEKSKKQNGLEKALISLCSEYNIDLTYELKFHPVRRWRFDYAIENIKTAFEYEGGVWGNSRHRSSFGFMGDCEKYNNALFLGWKVYRFTVKDFTKQNIKETILFLESIINLDKKL